MNLKTKRHTLAAVCCLCAVATLFAAGCGGAAPEGNNQAAAANANASSAATGAGELPAGANLDAEIERLEKVAERNPGDDTVSQSLAAVYVRRGNALRAAGDLRGALKEYRSAIKYDEDNEEAQKHLAEIVPQVEGEQTGEYGEPAPLPITPGVTTDADDDAPTPGPTQQKNANRKS
jgi:tetratricopeptide (TPR) repeat protein